MKIWSAINTDLVMALNLLYHNKIIHFLHYSFVNVQTDNYKIHLTTTASSAVLSITHLNKRVYSPYTEQMICKLETIIYDDDNLSKSEIVKQILLKIKPLLDET